MCYNNIKSGLGPGARPLFFWEKYAIYKKGSGADGGKGRAGGLSREDLGYRPGEELANVQEWDKDMQGYAPGGSGFSGRLGGSGL